MVSVGVNQKGNAGEKKSKKKSAESLVAQTSFRGHFEHTLDEKGRVSFPSTFREVLTKQKSNSVVITNYVSDGSRCLEGFSLKDWEVFEKNLAKKSRFDARLKQLENFYLSRACECPVDASGRITIPAHLRRYAGLTDDLVFTASIHGFRIWNSKVWDLVFQEAESALMDNPEMFKGIDE